MSEQHQERTQTAPSNVIIDNDLLPIAVAKEAVHWWRLDEVAANHVLEKSQGELLGWDVENDSVLGVSMSVQLAEVDHVASPPNLTANGNMIELLELIEHEDQCQLPVLAASNRCMYPHLNRKRWKPVVYTKVRSLVPVFSSKRLNLNLKVKLISFGNLSMIGDETGVVCMKVHSRPMFKLLRTLQEGASLIIRKASLRLRKGFGNPFCVHIDIDQDVGSIEVSREQFEFEPDMNCNISAKDTDFLGLEIDQPKSTIEPGEASSGDVVQVVYDMYSDSKVPMALTSGMKGVITKFNQNGDAQIAFAGEVRQTQWVNKDALSNFIFAEGRFSRKFHIDVSTLWERDLYRPGWSMDEFSEHSEPEPQESDSDSDPDSDLDPAYW